MRSPRLSWILAIWISLPAAYAATAREPSADPLGGPAPGRALRQYAASAGLPLTGIDFAPGRTEATNGDETILLITLLRGRQTQQWLVRVQLDELTDEERDRKPPPATTIHTSTGAKLNYGYTPQALRIELIGPFLAGEAPTARNAPRLAVKSARTVINRDFLTHGMAEYCRAGPDIVRRATQAGMPVKDLVYHAGGAPPSSEALARARPTTNALQLSEQEERDAFHVYFSLVTFFGAATEVPACRDILEEAIDQPSLWSIVRSLGVRVDLGYFWSEPQLASAERTGVEMSAYQLPVRLNLNGQPGLNATFIVTSPQPPLGSCAGIVAALLEHPTKPDRRIFMRLLAARCGERAADAPAAGGSL